MLGEIWSSHTLWPTMRTLCDDCNGRFVASDDERKAAAFICDSLARYGLSDAHTRGICRARLEARRSQPDGQRARLTCIGLPGTPPAATRSAACPSGQWRAGRLRARWRSRQRQDRARAGQGFAPPGEVCPRQCKPAVSVSLQRYRSRHVCRRRGACVRRQPAHHPGVGIAYETSCASSACRTVGDCAPADVRVRGVPCHGLERDRRHPRHRPELGTC